MIIGQVVWFHESSSQIWLTQQVTTVQPTKSAVRAQSATRLVTSTADGAAKLLIRSSVFGRVKFRRRWRHPPRKGRTALQPRVSHICSSQATRQNGQGTGSFALFGMLTSCQSKVLPLPPCPALGVSGGSRRRKRIAVVIVEIRSRGHRKRLEVRPAKAGAEVLPPHGHETATRRYAHWRAPPRPRHASDQPNSATVLTNAGTRWANSAQCARLITFGGSADRAQSRWHPRLLQRPRPRRPHHANLQILPRVRTGRGVSQTWIDEAFRQPCSRSYAIPARYSPSGAKVGAASLRSRAAIQLAQPATRLAAADIDKRTDDVAPDHVMQECVGVKVEAQHAAALLYDCR